MNVTPDLSVVIPVYNERDNLPELIDRCLAACQKTDAISKSSWWMMAAGTAPVISFSRPLINTLKSSA